MPALVTRYLRLYDFSNKRSYHVGMFVILDILNCAVATRSLTVLVMISSTSSLLTSKTPTLDLMTVSNCSLKCDLCVCVFYIDQMSTQGYTCIYLNNI